MRACAACRARAPCRLLALLHAMTVTMLTTTLVMLPPPTAAAADVSKFIDTLKKSLGQSIVLYVYNEPSDTVRPMVIIPHTSWPGAITKKDGAHWQLIGCGVVMDNKLHALPDAKRTTPGSLTGTRRRATVSVSVCVTPRAARTCSVDVARAAACARACVRVLCDGGAQTSRTSR